MKESIIQTATRQQLQQALTELERLINTSKYAGLILTYKFRAEQIKKELEKRKINHSKVFGAFLGNQVA